MIRRSNISYIWSTSCLYFNLDLGISSKIFPHWWNTQRHKRHFYKERKKESISLCDMTSTHLLMQDILSLTICIHFRGCPYAVWISCKMNLHLADHTQTLLQATDGLIVSVVMAILTTVKTSFAAQKFSPAETACLWKHGRRDNSVVEWGLLQPITIYWSVAALLHNPYCLLENVEDASALWEPRHQSARSTATMHPTIYKILPHT